MNRTMRFTLLALLVAFSLEGCNKNNGKTMKLKPENAEVVDKHEAVSILGKAIKATASDGNISLDLSSTKELTFSMSETVHNSIENTNSTTNAKIVANGLSTDYRMSYQEATEVEKEKVAMSVVSNIQSVHWEKESSSSNASNTRLDIDLSAYIKDDTFYLDPTDKELKSLVKDFLYMTGTDSYTTLVNLFLANRYYVTRSEIGDILKTLPDIGESDIDFNNLINILSSYFTENSVDNLIVGLDKHLDEWEWLTAYSLKDSDAMVFHASMDKEELVSFLVVLEEANRDEDTEPINWEEKFKNATFNSMELAITFAEKGLISVESLFDMVDEEKGLDAYEDSAIPLPGQDLPTEKKIGTKDVKVAISGGIKGLFGSLTPLDPPGDNWTSLAYLVDQVKKVIK